MDHGCLAFKFIRFFHNWSITFYLHIFLFLMEITGVQCFIILVNKFIDYHTWTNIVFKKFVQTLTLLICGHSNVKWGFQVSQNPLFSPRIQMLYCLLICISVLSQLTQTQILQSWMYHEYNKSHSKLWIFVITWHRCLRNLCKRSHQHDLWVIYIGQYLK